MVNNEQTGLKRNSLDKFYTCNNEVLKCIELLKKHIEIFNTDLCIEPSAGNGAFLKSIKELTKNALFYDLEPENNEIIKMNYLEFDHQTICSDFKRIHIIGNPPFGRQSSLAIKFIKKSLEFCHSISFILPKSFKKDSLHKHFPLEFHLECEYDLPKNSFIVEKNIYDVPCVFQIWVKKKFSRYVPKVIEPKNFKFVKINDSPDISFRRVGVNAGSVDINTCNKSTQSHYFLKFEFPFTQIFFDKITKLTFKQKDYTVGPLSISKQELIKELNTIIN